MPRSPGRSGRLVLRDAATIKALTHPARLAVIDELYGGRELTATECAELAGLSPSAMSYHLRALEKAGLVVRAESSDGRERPWRAAARGIEVDATDAHLTDAASSALVSTVLDKLTAGVTRWILQAPREDKKWRSAAGVYSSRLWLTVDELDELRAVYAEFIERYRDRGADDHPEGSRAVRAALVTFPLEEPPQRVGRRG